MKKTFLILFLVVLTVQTWGAKQALVIGIGKYPASTGWTQINGDADIPLVCDMLKKNGFNPQNITILKNEQATHDEIKRAFEVLTANAKKDDVMYIHFSGHGQRITDVSGDESNASAGWDEAWIAYDACKTFQKGVYEGENHVVDDELNAWLHKLRNKIGKKGHILVVADACHSGGGTRGDEDSTIVVRGTQDNFIIPMTKKQSNKVSTNTEDWVYISACRSYQCNYEYKGAGSLTYALCREQDNFSNLTFAVLIKKIQACFNRILPFTQTPELNAPEHLRNQIIMP